METLYKKEEADLVKKFYEKISSVRDTMDRIPKNGYNSFHKYHYATEDDVTTHIRKALKEFKLAYSVCCLSHRTFLKESGKKDYNITTADLIHKIIDLETGYFETFEFPGMGEDKGDKSLYKAYTGSVKYFLMKFFLLSTGDDPEDDSADKKKNDKPPEDLKKPVGDIATALESVKKCSKMKDIDTFKAWANGFSWKDTESKQIVEQVKEVQCFIESEGGK